MPKQQDDTFPEEEARRRFEATLRGALKTPPQPQKSKPKPKQKGSAEKPSPKR